MNKKRESVIFNDFRIKIPSQLSPGLYRNGRGKIVKVNGTSETKRQMEVEDPAERRPVGAERQREEKQEKDEREKDKAREEQGGKKVPRGNRRELVGTCIKGSYRDKGINTSTKCGEPDGRSSSKSYLFGVPLPLLFSPSLS